MREDRSCMEHFRGTCIYMFIRMCKGFIWSFCECVYVYLFTCVHRSVFLYTCMEIAAWSESVHVHYIRQSVRGVPQHVCTAVCSELSAPAGCAIPIYPSATEVGGKSAGNHCRRFHIRRTRLPVRRPLCEGDEGGRLQGNSVGELGLLGDAGVVRGGRAAQLNTTLESAGLSVFRGA